jgi:hypothetical protein
MSQSIDFRINDFINEYLDYKGYTNTVDAFFKERQNRKESINKTTNGNSREKEKLKTIKVFFSKKNYLINFY